jgi:hypothetical protein
MLKHVTVRTFVVASLLFVAAAALADSGAVVFRVRDDCDPATFNAVLGEGACIETFDGDTTFAEFGEELAEDREVGSWRFNPDAVTLDRGQRTFLESRAGEVHTFTRVARFGGGFVTELNEAGGFGAPVPECVTEDRPLPAPPSPTNILVPAGAHLHGPTAGSTEMPKGRTRWQCCIHPWMRSTVVVR